MYEVNKYYVMYILLQWNKVSSLGYFVLIPEAPPGISSSLLSEAEVLPPATKVHVPSLNSIIVYMFVSTFLLWVLTDKDVL